MSKIAAILIASFFIPQTQTVDLDLANKVLNSSVLIRSKQYRMNEDMKIKYGLVGCSGTYISNDTVLTAAHCFAQSSVKIWVRDYKGVSHEARIVKISPEHDLALLGVLKRSPHNVASIAKESPIGAKVISIGSPFGFEFLISEGIVASNRYKMKEFKSHYLLHTGMINSGSSGGGAFDCRGDLVGVNTMTVGSPFGWAGISMAVDIQTIKEFLR